MAQDRSFDVAIIGGGIAGLSVALRLAEGTRVALFTKGQLGESNTRYAQGGLTAALGEDDSPELHLQDTLNAGAGLCDEAAVRVLVEHAPEAVRWLIQQGVEFDRVKPGEAGHATADGLLLGREAAHSRWRVLHAGGDATGAEIERALTQKVNTRANVIVYEETVVQQLVMREGRCVGVEAVDRDGRMFVLEANAVVLASGGAGGLWLHTSNPAGATADGLALAWRAGAALSDLEFMQFHPTVMVVDGTSHLISEAVRGEGAYLRNHAGERFMPRYSEQAELAPRDVVARAILSEMVNEGESCEYLDLRHLPAEQMYARFPNITAICKLHGLDLARDLLPVAPAAHYCMGGVLVDTEGRTTLPGLYAVGEVACTGVHGANRLASNSLLEGLVYGLRIADHLAIGESDGAQNGIVIRQGLMWIEDELGVSEHVTKSERNVMDQLWGIWEVRREVREIMWKYVSLSRTREGLLIAEKRLQEIAEMVEEHEERTGQAREWLETRNMVEVAGVVVRAALVRCESRGSHWRLDYPQRDERLDGRHYVFVRAIEVESVEAMETEASGTEARNRVRMLRASSIH
jgi:L-aspartate oxidase